MTAQTTPSAEVAEVLARVVIRLVKDPFSDLYGARLREVMKLSGMGVNERRQATAYINRLLSGPKDRP